MCIYSILNIFKTFTTAFPTFHLFLHSQAQSERERREAERKLEAAQRKRREAERKLATAEREREEAERKLETAKREKREVEERLETAERRRREAEERLEESANTTFTVENVSNLRMVVCMCACIY